MKKIYINPTITTVKVVMPQIMAGSPGLQGDEINPNEMEARGSFTFDEGTSAPSVNIWDE